MGIRAASEPDLPGSEADRRTGRIFRGYSGPAAICLALLAGAFAADALLERGVAAGVLHVGAVAVTAWLPQKRTTLAVCMAAALLVMAGYWASPAGSVPWYAAANRALSLLAIGATATVVWYLKRQGERQASDAAILARSERLLRATVEASPTGMLLVDGEGRIALANPQAERLFAYGRDELLGRQVEALVPEAEREAHARWRTRFTAESEARRMAAGREVRGTDKYGRALPLEVGLMRLEFLAGDLTLVTLTDMAERGRIEDGESRRLAARRIVDAEEAQRRRISREIHDALGQSLTALKLDLGWLAGRLDGTSADLQTRVLELEERAARTIEDVRRLSSELRPTVLDDQGLYAAIRWLVAEFERRTRLRCGLALPDGEIPLGADADTVVFRVLQESLTNVMRHARASTANVALWREAGGDVLLEVRDDGRGIRAQPGAGHGTLGLLGMRERADLLGGTLTVGDGDGGGTTVLLRLPGRQATAARAAQETA